MNFDEEFNEKQKKKRCTYFISFNIRNLEQKRRFINDSVYKKKLSKKLHTFLWLNYELYHMRFGGDFPYFPYILLCFWE